jgi:5-(aminomethyl)-3-furanmethanol phosphate kinase
MIETVIKVGGSLGQSHQLPELLRKISELSHRHKTLIIPGGGAFADAVRDYDSRFGLDTDVSHWMSIMGMDQFGHLLASLIPNGVRVRGLAAAREVLEIGRVPVIMTYDLLRQTDALPRNWDVTSDSIAVWIAKLAEARQLVLLKSVDGIFQESSDANKRNELLEVANLSLLSQSQVVDRCFASIFEDTNLAGWLVNGNHPERLEQLLDQGVTFGTRLLP